MEFFESQEGIIRDMLEENFAIEIPFDLHPQLVSQIDELNCPVCQQLFNIPIVLPECQHMYCKGCLNQWIKNSGQTCPLCRTSIHKAKDSTSNEQTKFILIDYNTMFIVNNQQVNCQKPNCNWFGKLSDYQFHQDEECQLRKCENIGCNQMLNETEQQEHQLVQCKFRTINCPQYCGTTLRIGEVFKHLDECPFTYKECKPCQGIMQESQLIIHKCPKITTKCKQYLWGCTQQEEHNCIYEFNQCQKCCQQIMIKNIDQHKQVCIAATINNVLKDFKQQISNYANPNIPTLETLKSECAQQCILITNITLDVKTEQLLAIAKEFGYIINYKEYMNLQQKTDPVKKKMVIKFSHSRWMQQFKQYAPQSKLFQQHNIRIYQLQTKQQLPKSVLIAENIQHKDKMTVLKEYKQFDIQDAHFISNTTDWKKGKMYYTFALLFPSEVMAQECRRLQPNLKPYCSKQFQKQPVYNLDPYNQQKEQEDEDQEFYK